MNNLKNDTYGDSMPEVDELSNGETILIDIVEAMKKAKSKQEELIDLSPDELFKLSQKLIYDKELLRAVVSYLNEVIQKKAENG